MKKILTQYKRWKKSEIKIIEAAAEKYLKGNTSLYETLKLLKMKMPERSWTEIRSKFLKILPPHERDEIKYFSN
jgi:hypothetical protein